MQTREYQKMFQLEASHWWFVSKRNFIKSLLQLIKLPLKSSLLDIGCGTGINLRFLSQFGQAQGIDTSSLAIKLCQKRHLRVQQAQAAKLPFKPESFDLVTFFDVLYHQDVKSDIKALKQAYHILKPHSHILITDCAHQWLFSSHDKTMHARQRYSKKELEAKVIQAGFKITKSSYIFSFTFPFFVFNRLIKKSGSDVEPIPNFINQLLISALKLEASLLKYINLPFGSSIIILAQK